jgi:hypothetical protein
MQGRFGVARQGYGGGLALLWDSGVTLNIESYSQHHIDAKVIQEDGLQWRLTGFYGHPKVALRGNYCEGYMMEMKNLGWWLETLMKLLHWMKNQVWQIEVFHRWRHSREL